MKALMDRDLTNDLMKLGAGILKEHFQYDEESVSHFCNTFAKNVNNDYYSLCMSASEEFKHAIWGNKIALQKFTCTFAGFHLVKTLGDSMNFTNKELDLFEMLVSKYIKVVESNEPSKQTDERAPN